MSTVSDALVVASFVFCLLVVLKPVNVSASSRSPSADEASTVQLVVAAVFPASQTRVGVQHTALIVVIGTD